MVELFRLSQPIKRFCYETIYAPTVEKRVYTLLFCFSDQGDMPDYKQEIARPETPKHLLPATGESQSDTALFLACFSLAICSFFSKNTERLVFSKSFLNKITEAVYLFQ